MKMKMIFFRNDDVRSTLDASLIMLTDLFIKHNIPISHAVEPANISSEVKEWLLKTKQEHPDIIEIVQHGYSHQINFKTVKKGKEKKGEFGGSRTYQEQYPEIKIGKERMDELFGNNWFPLFTFPFNRRNEAAIIAVNDLGFIVVNEEMDVKLKHRLFNYVGRKIKKEMIAGRSVSWHLCYKPNTNLFQIDTSISVIKKFIDEQTSCEYYTLEQLKKMTLKYMKHIDIIGFVLHHRYDTKNTIQILDDLMIWLKSLDYVSFYSQENIYKTYGK